MENQPIRINRDQPESRKIFSDGPARGGVRSRESVAPAPDENLQSAVRQEQETETRAKDKKFIARIFDGVIGFSILAIFFGIPLFFTGLTLQGIVFEKQLYFYFFLLLGLVAWTARGVMTGEMNILRTPLDIPILGFWLAALVSVFFSVDRWHSFWGGFADPSRGFMNITALIIAYYLIVSNFSLKRLQTILFAMIFSSTLLSVWTILAILNIKFLPDSLAVFAPISLSGSVLGLGALISSMVPILTMAILKLTSSENNLEKGKKNILLGILFSSLALHLFLLLAIYNFVPWLGIFAGVVIFLVFILSQIVRPNPAWTWVPMIVFVLVMIVRMIGAVQIAKVNFAEVKPLDYGTSWQTGIESMKSKPLLGSGPATYGYDFSLNRPKEFNNNIFYNLRFLQGTGVFFESMATLGGAGTFFLLLAVLSFIGAELYFISRDKEKNKLFSLGVFSSALILILDIFSTKLEGTVVIMAAVLGALAIAVTLFESGSQENKLSLSLKASPKFALALAFVFMVVSAGVAFLFVFLGKIYAADAYAGAASRTKANNKDQAVVKMAKAVRLYPQESKYYTQLGQFYMLMANSEALRGENDRDVNKIKNYLNSSVALSLKGKEMNKNDVGAVEALAQIYENAGLYVADSLKLAQDNYQAALLLEPHNPNYYVKLGQIKISQASSEKDQAKKKQFITDASEMFNKAIEKKENLAEAHYQLSIAQNALEQDDQAIESGRKALQFSKKNQNYILGLAKLYQARGGEEDLKNAGQLFKAAIAQNDNDINAHFYLGLLLEKEKKKSEAKDEYNKVKDLLVGDNNSDTRKQIDKMISNIDAGIENTPQSLGLVQTNKTSSESPREITGEVAPQAASPVSPGVSATQSGEENSSGVQPASNFIQPGQ